MYKRQNEGCALQWNDVDFDKQRLRVHHMLIVKNKKEWTRNSYSKTKDGRRMISLDKDTIDAVSYTHLDVYKRQVYPIMRIKLVAATAPTLIKALVLTLFNILDLLSIKTRSSIPDKS